MGLASRQSPAWAIDRHKSVTCARGCDIFLPALEPHDAFPHQEISAQLGMSLGMVMRYSKHIDQERLAREANKKRT